MENFSKSRDRGFSLIEALVAVAIFVFAILAPLRIASQSLLASVSAKDTLIATGLARDAIEFVHFKRNANASTGVTWTNEMFQGDGNTMCGSTSGCKVDTSVVFSINFSANNGEVLRLNETNGLYGYNANWTATKYTRVVSIRGVDNTSAPQIQIAVEVSVSWETAPGVIKTVRLKEYLFNWISEEKT